MLYFPVPDVNIAHLSERSDLKVWLVQKLPSLLHTVTQTPSHSNTDGRVQLWWGEGTLSYNCHTLDKPSNSANRTRSLVAWQFNECDCAHHFLGDKCPQYYLWSRKSSEKSRAEPSLAPCAPSLLMLQHVQFLNYKLCYSHP